MLDIIMPGSIAVSFVAIQAFEPSAIAQSVALARGPARQETT
jgi:hypothetical protein